MNLKVVHIAAILVRLFGIVYLLKSFYALPIVIDDWMSSDARQYFSTFYIAILSSQFLVSALAVWLPQTVAIFLLPGGYGDLEIHAADARDFQISAFAVLGAYFACSSLPQLLLNLHWLFSLSNQGAIEEGFADKIKPKVFLSTVEFSAGIFLLFGARGLHNFVVKFRRDD